MEQSELFVETPGTILTELCVDAVTGGDSELMAIARDLLALVHYHDRKMLAGQL